MSQVSCSFWHRNQYPCNPAKKKRAPFKVPFWRPRWRHPQIISALGLRIPHKLRPPNWCLCKTPRWGDIWTVPARYQCFCRHQRACTSEERLPDIADTYFINDEHVKYSHHKKSEIYKKDLSQEMLWYNANPYFSQKVVMALALAAKVGFAFPHSSMSDTHFASASATSAKGSLCKSLARAVQVRRQNSSIFERCAVSWPAMVPVLCSQALSGLRFILLGDANTLWFITPSFTAANEKADSFFPVIRSVIHSRWDNRWFI